MSCSILSPRPQRPLAATVEQALLGTGHSHGVIDSKSIPVFSFDTMAQLEHHPTTYCHTDGSLVTSSRARSFFDTSFQIIDKSHPRAQLPSETAKTPEAGCSLKELIPTLPSNKASQQHLAAYCHKNRAVADSRGEPTCLYVTFPIEEKIQPAAPLPFVKKKCTDGRRARPKVDRPKVHGCHICPKAFDRPSTLRKHLLVHTGEKPYPCGICGRSFGVPSNLNRHLRRCASRPFNVLQGLKAACLVEPKAPSGHPLASFSSPNWNSAAVSGYLMIKPSNPLGTIPTPDAPLYASRSTGVDESSCFHLSLSPYQWVPASLRDFNLTPILEPCPVPLPPITWSISDERDSYDRSVPENPYHPEGWSGKLPGPAVVVNTFSGPTDIRHIYGLVVV